MNVFITGKGTAGAWQVRAVQLGKAIGARVQANARGFGDADLIVVVKRLNIEMLHAIRESGLPWVWDCVDSYPQPGCGEWSRDETIRWAQGRITELQPDAIIWPNKRMQEDVGFYGPQMVLYHHGRPDSRVGVIRANIHEVGYEGLERYLGEYAPWLTRECARRGWKFTINPPCLGDVDIVVAFREGPHNGFAQHAWKSNIKLANAQISGRPFVGAPEDGYRETASGAEIFTVTRAGIKEAFDILQGVQTRTEISERMIAKAPRIHDIAKQYQEFLSISKF